MKKNYIVVLMILLGVGSNLSASNKISQITYNPNDTMIVKAKEGFLTIIEFDEDEEVLDGDTGFNEGWVVKKSGNIAHLTPKPYMSSIAEEEGTGGIVKKSSIIQPNKKDWNTNFFIRTNKRLYVGDLELSNYKSNYKIKMKYPKEDFKKKKEAWEEIKKTRSKKNIEKDLNRVTVPRNWDFYKKVNKRSGDIAPNYVYDDGKFTYFGFDRTKKMPAIFTREGEDELSTNSHTKKIGRYYVKIVHKTAKVFFLRSGRKLVGVLNSGYGENPNLDFDTTSNSLIKRVIK